MNHTDQRIDQLLHALATRPTPAGLEQRIVARMEQRAAAKSAPRLPFFTRVLRIRACHYAISSFPLYTIAAASVVLLAAGYLALLRQHPLRQVATFTPTASKTGAPQLLNVLSGGALTAHPAGGTRRPHPTTADVAQPPPAQDDPDTIALAETLAPSHPAPPLPLTSQEALLLRSTRHGQPIEVAELETHRESALIALASAREQSSIREYIHGLLGPLATAQALTPPSSSPPSQTDDSTPVAYPEPPSSK